MDNNHIMVEENIADDAAMNDVIDDHDNHGNENSDDDSVDDIDDSDGEDAVAALMGYCGECECCDAHFEHAPDWMHHEMKNQMTLVETVVQRAKDLIDRETENNVLVSQRSDEREQIYRDDAAKREQMCRDDAVERREQMSKMIEQTKSIVEIQKEEFARRLSEAEARGFAEARKWEDAYWQLKDKFFELQTRVDFFEDVKTANSSEQKCGPELNDKFEELQTQVDLQNGKLSNSIGNVNGAEKMSKGQKLTEDAEPTTENRSSNLNGDKRYSRKNSRISFGVHGQWSKMI